ncbi:MAG: DUF4262 domain-containing protein [Microthrixaceae bacterium]|nr:DUF4262 domain-containing protein [Microthrixaceae bacterium]MCO5312376.1 DUF4262 domain-containing protein [Microthrixaceae bacterium]HPB44457.1 DUF4262 domain-containing protein [Microthrixaceae bacterium]
MTDDVFPDRNMEHLDKISWVIETNGWCAEPVAASADPPAPGYTYTIGFEPSYGASEVVIFGLQPVAARGLLELIHAQISNGLTIPDGIFVGLLDNDLRAAMLPLDLDEVADLFPDATALLGADGYRMSQFVWPDRNGLLPWEDGYDERLRLAQPVLAA